MLPAIWPTGTTEGVHTRLLEATCRGAGTPDGDHCCYVAGEPCRFLEVDTMPGRHWVCGLRRELGSWDAVHVDSRYVEHVQPMFDRIGGSCGEFGPAQKQCCYAEVM